MPWATNASNRFSDTWIAAFLADRDEASTLREGSFVGGFLAPGSTVLDMACGYGRHAAILSRFGHRVVGLDRDARMLQRAATTCRVVRGDMRHLPFAANSFDAAVNLWQSFGYFTADRNEAVLRDLSRVVRRDGLLILDLYTRRMFERATGRREFVRAGVAIEESTTLRGDRVIVVLIYDGGAAGRDRFEWQIFSPVEIRTMASRAGWLLLDQFEDFDAERRAAADCGRSQYLFRNRTAR